LSKATEAFEGAQILADLPSRIHSAMNRAVVAAPDRSALIEDENVWTYAQTASASSPA
jgi:hypothetical protein